MSRELAENALDAGASRIAISVDPQQWFVSVADNGCGMNRQDLQQAASPHSTSKIQDFNDLHQITSLGFRGEALHSLAQLAQLKIYSRQGDDPGWQAHYSRAGEIKTLTPTAIAPGTIVEVHHLFQHWPQRRDALPSAPQQLRAIQQVLQNLALCHPNVSWQIRKGNKPWFSLTPGPSPREILPQLLRGVTRDDVYYSRDSSLELLLGRPDRCHRGRADWLKFAVNGRVVTLPDLEHTLLSALSRSLPRNRYPLSFLHLRVPPRTTRLEPPPRQTRNLPPKQRPVANPTPGNHRSRPRPRVPQPIRSFPSPSTAASSRRLSRLSPRPHPSRERPSLDAPTGDRSSQPHLHRRRTPRRPLACRTTHRP